MSDKLQLVVKVGNTRLGKPSCKLTNLLDKLKHVGHFVRALCRERRLVAASRRIPHPNGIDLQVKLKTKHSPLQMQKGVSC